ncbi:hypothetical protein BKA69DRAFT_591922 [Paraphysoderma sedebokerense]|nr:hypothetical protein BKA69DRAFT_591922 [Paraphysoderma sedebokerense]
MNILNSLSFINFNIELTSPECVINQRLDYGTKMRFTLAIPLALLVLVILFGVIVSINKKIRARCKKSRPKLYNHEPQQTSLFLTSLRIFNSILSIVFATVSTKALSILDCTLEEDGLMYLDADYSVRCYSEEWYRDLPYALSGIAIYVIGIPLYFSIMLFVMYQKKYDASRWEKRRAIVSKIMDFDHIYKDENQHFILIQLFQKLALISTSMYFTRLPGLQVILSQTVLLLSLVLHLKYQPYKYPLLNHFEVASTMASMSILGLALPFHVDKLQRNSELVLMLFMLFLVLSFIAAVIGTSVYEIQRKVRAGLNEVRKSKKEGSQNILVTASTRALIGGGM